MQIVFLLLVSFLLIGTIYVVFRSPSNNKKESDKETHYTFKI